MARANILKKVTKKALENAPENIHLLIFSACSIATWKEKSNGSQTKIFPIFAPK